MENDWSTCFEINPIPILLTSKQKAIRYFTQRDFLCESVEAIEILWQESEAQRILKKQLADSSWPSSAKNQHPAINYCLIETWRNLRFLIEMYGFTRAHPQIEKAAEFIFSCQSPDSDLRGILANQYATYYTGAILSLLIKAGYQEDHRVEKAMRWLLSIRQDDLGWSIPMITHKFSREEQYQLSSQFMVPVEPDRSKPFSHNATGMVLRAFAAHEKYRHSVDAISAAHLLKSRFFEKDAYTSYQSASYWVRFEYPFWWNQLVSAMDSISIIMPDNTDTQIQKALQWFLAHQREDGLWNTTYVADKEPQSPKTSIKREWITLAICRIFARLNNA
ncbi:MAG: terpene cyclase/mutase family protein [Anaerolineaceae bacterium]|nr:terpene cyclase/mutase family protein [Anaerolineaceae bacterium]